MFRRSAQHPAIQLHAQLRCQTDDLPAVSSRLSGRPTPLRHRSLSADRRSGPSRASSVPLAGHSEAASQGVFFSTDPAGTVEILKEFNYGYDVVKLYDVICSIFPRVRGRLQEAEHLSATSKFWSVPPRCATVSLYSPTFAGTSSDCLV